MQNICSKRLCNDESFALTSDNSFPLASAANAAASARAMKRSFNTGPTFEATSAALEPTSSPSRLISDPMFAQFDDPLFVEHGFELSPLSYDEASEWFLNEPLKVNGEPFSDGIMDCAIVKSSNDCCLRSTNDAYTTEIVDVNSLTRDPIITVARMDSGPLSPSPMADVKMEVKSEGDESPEIVHSSKVPFNSLESKVVKRGRPMKITSRSKQALYAREYRRKNKQALWNYERRVKEQDDEIMRLRNQNKRMQEKLSKLICMKDAINKHYDGPIQDHMQALKITLAEIRSHPSTKQLLHSTGCGAFCVHVNGESFSILSCEACNARKTKLPEHIAEEIKNENVELFNGDFESIKDFIR
uniref:BZIP domain-containing protein n=1 Tax=Ascaris lumbricoides TaxID=6252 RepID=A0A0M3IAX7_ASCLU